MRKYNPTQPRDPKGSSTGGRWTSKGSGAQSAADAAREAAGLPQADTYQKYFDPVTGKWDPEREKLHQEIIDSFFAGKTPVDNPESFLMGGGAGAGKSSILESGEIKIPENTVVSNSDLVKVMLPEYGTGTGAPIVHEESSYLAKKIMAKAANEKYNVVLDGTGNKNVEAVNKKIKQLSPHGQPVKGVYCTCDIEEALSRAVIRQKKTGRFVPTPVIVDTHKGVSRIFGDLINTSGFKTLYLYDTNQKPPILIAKGTPGNMTILRSDLFKRFLDKSTWDKL